MTGITWTPENAQRELNRLTEIKFNLESQIEMLEANPELHRDSHMWVKIYTTRIIENVMPAIKECEEYLILMDKLVPGTQTQHH